MKRIIQWQSQHLEVDPLSGKLSEADENKIDEEYYDDNENIGYDDDMQPTDIKNVLSTPFGFWRIDDSLNPYKQFKMWMGHTNFTITPEIRDVIKDVPGVEVLQVMTRYRFIIGVAELFDIHDVRLVIEDQLNCHKDGKLLINDEKLSQQVEDLKKQLSIYNQWAIYVFPNGEIDFTTSEEDSFGSQLNLFKQAIDHSNGVLIESDNE